VGLRQRQLANLARRREPDYVEAAPDCGRGSSVKRWARFHARSKAAPVKVKEPWKYLPRHGRGS
jgi:hypothetical protein